MKHMKIFLIGIAVVCLLFAATGPSRAEVIKIDLSLAMSGPTSDAGQP